MDEEMVENVRKKKKKFVGIKSKMKNMSREAVQAALLKKKQCNDEAIKVVQSLIETGISEEFFLNNLFYINQCHFDDIIEERAITKLCGYPLCNTLLSSIPSKQYRISTKTNKVYDITERKNFCSNLCYKASQYLKNQLYTSPLWLRECESKVTFNLLPLTVNKGSSGEEVDFGQSKLTSVTALEGLEELQEGGGKVQNVNFTKVSTADQLLSDKMSSLLKIDETVPQHQEIEGSENAKPLSYPENSEFFEDMSSVHDLKIEKISLSERQEVSLPERNIHNLKHHLISNENENNSKHMKIEEKSKPNINKMNVDRPLAKRKVRNLQKIDSIKEVVVKIENVIRSWFTFETVCFILGEEKVKEELNNYGIELKRKNEDPYLYDRYTELCRKLNLLELEETYGPKDNMAPSGPAPDYNKLKEEAKLLEIKVKSFYKAGAQVQFNIETPDDLPEEQLPVLPSVDHHALRATRNKIFLHKLHRTLPDIQTALGLGRYNLNDQIKEIVATFNLSAQNISLKPSEWNIAAIVLIKLLSIRDINLASGLASQMASKYLELILMSYTLDSGYLDRLVIWLLDFNHLISILSN